VSFFLQGYAQSAKCKTFTQDIVKNVNGKVVSEYVSLDDETFYVIKAEVPSSCNFDNVKAACDAVNNDAKVVSDWKINYDKNYEKRFSINGKMVLVIFYPNDKMIYFEIPKY
jgi:hypothetical protein